MNFIPVQCTDETFQNLRPNEGYVYFVTDTKKIFLGKDGNMIPMAASSGIFYGTQEIEYENDGNAPNPEVYFDWTQIEKSDETKPEEDDLILNIDGCFYRVEEVEEDRCKTRRLTLQGTGGSLGPGGDSSGGTVTGSFSITVIDGKTKAFGSSDTEMKFSFRGNYNGTDGNVINRIEFKRKGDDAPFYTIDEQKPFNQDIEVSLYKYRHLFGSSKTTVTIYVYDLYEQERSSSITVQIVELGLAKIREELLVSRNNNYSYACKISGGLSGVEDRQITYSIYNQDNLFKPVYQYSKETSDEDEIQTLLDLSSLLHGVYVLKVQASARLIGTNKFLYSNTLTHKIAKYDETTNEPLLMISVPEVLEQYTDIPMSYVVLTNESNKDYTLDVQLNKVTKAQLGVKSNVSDDYNLYFETAGTYTLDVEVIEMNITYTAPITISKYTGELPVIDSARDDLMLYLNPRDKSNNALDRDQWADYRGDNTVNKIMTGYLNGLHYGSANGWLKDADGASYLQLSSGASFTMPNFRPFEKDPTIPNVNDTRMGSGMTIELDFEVNGVLDYDTELIKCLSRNPDGKIQVGFAVTGDRIRFYNSSGLVLSLNLVEGKRTKVSFVIDPNRENTYPMVYGYLNGKLSGAVFYESTESFKDISNGWATLQAYSDDAQVKIYGIRIYTAALGDRVILNNYTASLSTLEDRQKAYSSNNVYNPISGLVDFEKVSSEEYDLQIPYMTIVGGWATEKESKWQLKDFANANQGLPTGKKDYRLIDVKVVYPDNDYFNEYENYEFINKFESGKTMDKAYGEKPSNGGAIMYAQGTSSMEYPIKNLRLRFKNEDKWYKVRPDIANVEIICMKADYMESSGSHNTGAANLVDALYEGMNIATPGQKHFEAPNNTIVTCIKGHPCLIFYSKTGERDSFEYIGKYNLNLDKATPEPFGFDHDDSNFGYMVDENGELVLDGEGKKQNDIHCFEFLDNAVEVCNFTNKYKAYVDDGNGNMIPDPSGGIHTYEETWYNTFTNKDNELVPGWTLGFESRYPEDIMDAHGADSLYTLASWINELYSLRNGLYGVEKNETLALERFRDEYWKYLDKDFTLTYYLLTEALLMADSRVKNMMIATWGKEWRYLWSDGSITTTTTPPSESVTLSDSHFGYIFYPIFYDMDTMMGLDNTGVYRFNYYDEDTNASVFNGDEVLWTFVRDALPKTDLMQHYNKMESSLLYVSKDSDTGKDLGILSYFNENQANMANEAFYNGDAKYKYIDPARNGYHDDLYDKDIAAGVGPYLYAAQGDRSLMREWFMTNRMRFLCGKYNSTRFQQGDRIDYRQYYPQGTESEFVGHEASITAVPPSGTFNLKSVKTGYAGILLGANGNTAVERFDGEQERPITVPNMAAANGTEAYILGLSNLSDLGDLSDKYMQKFIINSSEVRLKNLTLGNPHRDYYNPYWSTSAEGQSPSIDVSKAIYLETFNLQNCAAYKSGLNFSNCKAIRKILLTGSGVNTLILPTSGVLTELRLPTSVNKISIDSHASLTPDKFSIGGYQYDESLEYENIKIGSGNGIYLNDYTSLTSLKVIDTNIDTYSIVRGARNLDEYCLRGVNWTITENDIQYCLRENKNLTPEQIKSYYKYNAETQTYEPWGQETYPTDNTFLYEKVEMIQNNLITCIPVLEFLMTKNIIDSATKAEALTGTITINIPNVAANELEIYEKYVDIYPDLEIVFSTDMGSNVIRAHRIKFYRVPYVEGINATNLTPYYTRLTDGTKTLTELIANDFSNPTKASSATEIFTFNGKWTDVSDTNKTVYNQFNTSSNNNFSSTKPAKDMMLLPHFTVEERQYTVNFYDHDGQTLLFSTTGPYMSKVRDRLSSDNLVKAYYIYRSNEGLNDNERWSLAGWESEVDFNAQVTNPTLYNLAELSIVSDLKLYAYYVTENVYETATTLEAFDISSEPEKFEVGEEKDIFYLTGYCISIKDSYKNILQGKITLPKADANGNPIIAVKNFNGCTKITELYFQTNGCQYKVIRKSAFNTNASIQKIHFPDSLTIIDFRAFNEASALKTIIWGTGLTRIEQEAFWKCSSLSITSLPEGLESLGTRVFSSCGKGIRLTSLPNSLKRIGTQCFISDTNVVIPYLGKVNSLGEKDDNHPSQLQELGHMCFGHGCTDRSITTIVIGPNISLIASSGSYGIFYESYPGVTDLIVYSNDTSITGADMFHRNGVNVTLRT